MVRRPPGDTVQVDAMMSVRRTDARCVWAAVPAVVAAGRSWASLSICLCQRLLLGLDAGGRWR